MKKLDSMLINQTWLDKFPSTFAEFLSPSISDHSPFLVKVSTPTSRKGKPFKFFNYWTSLDKFNETVDKAWTKNIDDTFQF